MKFIDFKNTPEDVTKRLGTTAKVGRFLGWAQIVLLPVIILMAMNDQAVEPGLRPAVAVVSVIAQAAFGIFLIVQSRKLAAILKQTDLQQAVTPLNWMLPIVAIVGILSLGAAGAGYLIVFYAAMLGRARYDLHKLSAPPAA
jgi:hypothetical protein